LNKPYLTVSAVRIARSRGLWLLILIVAAALTVRVLQTFEGTLEQAVTLALFIPLLIGTGGNSGAQASTAVIRAMALGEVRFADLPRVVWREARVGQFQRSVHGPGMMPGLSPDPDRWRTQDARNTVVVARSRRDRPRVDREHRHELG
jgi:Mg/Co/Ni transporter MgtE